MKKQFQKISTLILFLLQGFLLFSQSFIPGQSYFGTDDYVEYIAGNLPIIISAPHGGYLEPQEIPDRSCTGCVYLRDSYTQELSREILDSMIAQTGCYPHVIINRLHRKKLDANRDKPEAAVGDRRAELAWDEYHEFIDSAKAEVMRVYGKGIFLDMHGHAHTIQRIELGYLLTRSNLQLPDSILDTPNYVNRSSIKNLVNNNLLGHSHSTLLRSSFGLGTMFGNASFPSVPSMQDPYPMGTDPFFSGGYNTARHGSRDSGRIDAIQLECYRNLRFTEFTRRRFAGELGRAIVEYLEIYYFPDFSSNLCNNNTAIEKEIDSKPIFNMYPNPANERVFIHFNKAEAYQLVLYDIHGNKLLEQNKRPNQRSVELDLVYIPNAMYYMVVRDKRGIVATQKLFIR
jgi:N-formylglutamate amidohydrolase